MLTMVRAYNSSPDPLIMPLTLAGRSDADIIQLANIDGLDPVKASISTTPLASGRGVSFGGSNVDVRNLVLTLIPVPDWENWTISKIRNFIYKYFMPEMPVRFEFESDDLPPVEISGYVETCVPNIFSKDPEIQVSVICPDPDFVAIDPTVINGHTNDATLALNYDGTVDTPITVRIPQSSVSNPPNNITIHVRDGEPEFKVTLSSDVVTAGKYFEMNSATGQKYVQNVAVPSGAITNLLSKLTSDSVWPVLKPGANKFKVSGEASTGVVDWTLTYFERFGGL